MGYTIADFKFTEDWWNRCLKDESKLNAWIQKLQVTEISGYTDWIDRYIPKFRKQIPPRTEAILLNIAFDEAKHSSLLLGLMEERKILQLPGVTCTSTYWKDMYENMVSFEDCLAINQLGEDLAAFRFEVILEMPETPSDIREVLKLILPDEIFHRTTLRYLAGNDAIERMKEHHDKAVAKLKGNQ